MSAEFGDISFFHNKIRDAADDCRTEGSHRLTKMWGKFLDELYELAYNVSLSEAGDSTNESIAAEQIYRIQKLKKRLALIETAYRWFENKRKKGL